MAAKIITTGPPPRDDLSGREFPNFRVVRYLGRKSGHPTYECLCRCGKTFTRTKYLMFHGNPTSMSCGCVMIANLVAASTTHGGAHAPEYGAFSTMHSRCYNPNFPKYARYGARGIKICERWLHSFGNFIADMGPRPSPKHSIERKDNDGDYCPENCKWATAKEQANNKSDSRRIEYQGKSLSLADWSAATRLPHSIISARLHSGWTIERALTEPCGAGEKRVEFNGETMTVAQWARRLGMKPVTLYNRLNGHGWSVERALTTPVRHATSRSLRME